MLPRGTEKHHVCSAGMADKQLPGNSQMEASRQLESLEHNDNGQCPYHVTVSCFNARGLRAHDN